jgi:hypothetical protein
MTWPFKKTPIPPEPAATTATVPTQVTDTSLRSGMWVTINGAVGIISNVFNDSVVVTHTKADGTNVMILGADDKVEPHTVEYPRAQVTPAKVTEIPRNRYESVEQLRALGYKE